MNSNYPQISIIIPHFNRPHYLDQLLESVAVQSIREQLEVIIVDDASRPEEVEKIKELATKYAEINTQLMLLTSNGGVSHARNVGLEKATGKYVVFIDSDDLLCGRYCLQRRLETVEQYSNFDGVAGFTLKLDAENKVRLSKPPAVTEKLMQDCIQFPQQLAQLFCEYYINKQKVIFFIAGGCIFRRSSIQDLKFDTSLRTNEDVNWLLDFFIQGKKIKLIAEHVYFKRSHGEGQLSADITDEIEQMTISKTKDLLAKLTQ